MWTGTQKSNIYHFKLDSESMQNVQTQNPQCKHKDSSTWTNCSRKKLCKNHDSTVDLLMFLVKWHCIHEFKIIQFAVGNFMWNRWQWWNWKLMVSHEKLKFKNNIWESLFYIHFFCICVIFSDIVYFLVRNTK